MLADGLDRLEHAPVDPFGDTGRLAARVRRLDLEPLPTSGCSRRAAR